MDSYTKAFTISGTIFGNSPIPSAWHMARYSYPEERSIKDKEGIELQAEISQAAFAVVAAVAPSVHNPESPTPLN